VRLEPLTPLHAAAMDELARDADVARFTRVPEPVPAGFGAQWVDRYVRGWERGENAGFAICAAGSGDFLGLIGLVQLDAVAAEAAEVGYIVAAEARGRGVGTRALRLLSDWAFHALRLERIELRVDMGNAASARVAERAGFTREGVLRSVYVKDGVRADQIVFSRLRSDRAP
jgi:RimJ/RimL family protein N-acetyltransferase